MAEMQTTVTARHCELPEDLRKRAEQLMQRMAKKFHRAQRAQVIFQADNHRKVVEIQLSLPRGQMRVASAEAEDFRSALDRAKEKLVHQLDKTGRRYHRRTRQSGKDR
jgi:ribosomal subunit interface protein